MSHIVIEDVTPSVDGGRYPAKRIAGERCVVEADIFRDGHQVLRAAVKWRRKQDETFDEAPMLVVDNDRWRGEFLPTDNARYVFTIEAWTDLFATWLADFTKKVSAARPLGSDLLEGIALVEKIAADDRAGLLGDHAEEARMSQHHAHYTGSAGRVRKIRGKIMGAGDGGKSRVQYSPAFPSILNPALAN